MSGPSDGSPPVGPDIMGGCRVTPADGGEDLTEHEEKPPDRLNPRALLALHSKFELHYFIRIIFLEYVSSPARSL